MLFAGVEIAWVETNSITDNFDTDSSLRFIFFDVRHLITQTNENRSWQLEQN